MNAQEALKLTKQNWCDKEQDYMKYVIGYQSKVEDAAKEGQVTCAVGMIPGNNASVISFVAAFFEGQGYYVGFSGTPTGEAVVTLNWKQEPTGSRPWKESKDFYKSISE